MGNEIKLSTKLWDAVPGFDFNKEVDVPEMHSYFHDGVHSVPRLTPMYSCLYGRHNPMGSQYACETLSVPKSKGWSQKIKDGATYVAMHIVRDEAEIEKRTAQFQKAMIPWIWTKRPISIFSITYGTWSPPTEGCGKFIFWECMFP